MAVRCAFSEFRIGRDILIGTTIAILTLAIQVREHLIPVVDWQEHKRWWILSFVLPYIVVLGCHATWKFIRAPWLLYRETERKREIAFAKLKEQNEKDLAAAREEKHLSQKLVIHSAIYGTGEMNDVSVLGTIKNMARDALVIPVDNNLVYGKDPAPNQPKRIVVEYSYGESPRRKVQRPESALGRPSRLVLPEDSEISRLVQELEILRSAAGSATEVQRRLQEALSESANKHRAELAALRRDWTKEWKDQSEKFQKLSRSGIRADWHDTSAGTGWRICGGDVEGTRHMDILCRIAGNLLVASPVLSSTIPSDIKAEPNPAWRWLYYMKQSGFGYEPEHPGAYEVFEDGKKRFVHAGTIRNIGGESANLCLDLAGREVLGSR
jgi:hypothetical protein